MSLTRLKRQGFYSCVCSSILMLVYLYVFYIVSGCLSAAILFTVVSAFCGWLAGAFELAVRERTDLMKRYLVSVSALFIVAALFMGDALKAAWLSALYGLLYVLWLVGAKKCIQHEICPGWTLLLYDSTENLERAKAITEAKKELIVEASRYDYGNAKRTVLSLDEVDRMIRMFQIPQMVVCLETGNTAVLEYCKNIGVTAFVKEQNGCRGLKIGKDGLRCIRPVSTLRERFYEKLIRWIKTE